MARKGKSTEEIISALREGRFILDRARRGEDLPGFGIRSETILPPVFNLSNAALQGHTSRCEVIS